MTTLLQIARIEMEEVVLGDPIQFPENPKAAAAEDALNLACPISEVRLWRAAPTL